MQNLLIVDIGVVTIDVLLIQTPVIGCREMYTTQQLEILKNPLSAAIATPG